MIPREVLEKAKIKLMRHRPVVDLTYHKESDSGASFEVWISNFTGQLGARKAVKHLCRANPSLDEDRIIEVMVTAILHCYDCACPSSWTRNNVSRAEAKKKANTHAKALSAILEDVHLSRGESFRLENHFGERKNFEVSASELQILTKLKDEFADAAKTPIKKGRPEGADDYGELADRLARLFQATIGRKVYEATAALINVTYPKRKPRVTPATLKSLRSAKG